VPSIIWRLGKHELYWQPVLSILKGTDLVIVEQASKLLVNYVLLIQNATGIRKLALWGHGKNFQESSASPFGEWIKRQVSTHVHWWFAYNDLSVRIVQSLGYPLERITPVYNAVDTRTIARDLQNISNEDRIATRRELGISSEQVAIYAGGLYPEKRLRFLLPALQMIRSDIPDFEMIFIGGGVDAGLIQDAARQFPWIHYLGPKFDREKVSYYAISKLFLMPGLVGLGILDAFALETPLVTTQVPLHSPEIDYLKHGVNGFMVDQSDNLQAYADAVVYLLRNETERQRLIQGCQISREIYTLENMVNRFAQGVELALGA
jgi:glycosyltransferase involved in cell wall biosynthesis